MGGSKTFALVQGCITELDWGVLIERIILGTLSVDE
jgi:hypothetical protein